MNRYLMIHRLRWPAILLLTGVIALLDQADVVSWGRAWPLYLILFGVFALAERATINSQPPTAVYPYADPYQPGYPQQAPYPSQQGYGPGPGPGYAPVYGAAYPQSQPTPSPAPVQQTGIVPVSGIHGLTNTEIGTNRDEEER